MLGRQDDPDVSWQQDSPTDASSRVTRNAYPSTMPIGGSLSPEGVDCSSWWSNEELKFKIWCRERNHGCTYPST